MTTALAAGGWAAAGLAVLLAVLVRRERSRRGELVARAVHELRRPLAAARLGLYGLERLGERAGERARALDAELERAAAALADLDAARSGKAAAIRAEPVAVGDLIAQTAATWLPLARLHGAELQVEVGAPDAVVRGDRVRLTQACGNLLANALEHGHGAVELRGRAAGERVHIEVLDRGPGLPAPVSELARGARAGRGRRGRGLAIAAEIAARHGGRLSAAPTGEGARVSLELPIVDAPAGGR